MQTQPLQIHNPHPTINTAGLDAKELRIAERIVDLVSGSYEVGALLREMMVERGEEWLFEFAAKIRNPFITGPYLKRMSMIGVKYVPACAISSASGMKALARLPITIQERYVNEPVEVLLSNGDTLKIDAHNLQPEQARQVFAGDHVRDIPEQRAWIEEQKTLAERARKPKARGIPYEIVGNKLVIYEPCTLTKATLTRLKAQIK